MMNQKFGQMQIRNSKAALLTYRPITASISNPSPKFIEVMDRTFDWLGLCGYDGVDYGSLGSLDVSQEQLSCWKRAAEDNGLTYNSMHFRSYCFDALASAANTEKFIMDARRDIEIAGIMNCSTLAFHIADCPNVSRNEFIERNAELFANFINYVKTTNVTICLENHYPTRDGKDVGDLLDILSLIGADDFYGICFDTGHSVLAGLKPHEQILKAGKNLKTLHLHDNFGKKDSHLVPGLGVIDWFDIFSSLDTIGYNGALNMEIGGHHSHDTVESVAIAGMHCILQLLSEFKDNQYC